MAVHGAGRRSRESTIPGTTTRSPASPRAATAIPSRCSSRAPRGPVSGTWTATNSSTTRWAGAARSSGTPRTASRRRSARCSTTATILPFPHPVEMDVSRMLVEEFPGNDMVTFGKNGSDVCTIAARLARVVTKKTVDPLLRLPRLAGLCAGLFQFRRLRYSRPARTDAPQIHLQRPGGVPRVVRPVQARSGGRDD